MTFGPLVGASARRDARPCGKLPAVSLLTELDAFYTDHRQCGELDAGVDGLIVWLACECGARMVRHATAPTGDSGGQSIG